MATGRCTLEGLVNMAAGTVEAPGDFWKDRKVFVTGATGIVGAWLVRALIQRRAEVVALVRDADPQSELYRTGDIHRIAVISGCLEDFQTLERAINEHEVETVFHLAAVALGAMSLERHITLDRAMYGSDQAASLEPDGLLRLVRDVRVVAQALGDGEKRVYESEQANLKRLGHSE